MRLNLGHELSPYCRDNVFGFYPLENLKDIVFLQIILEKLLVIPIAFIGKIGAIGIKIGVKLPIYGISNKTTSTKNQDFILFQ